MEVKNKISAVVIGSDPEVFLFNKAEDRIVSSLPWIPGTKHEPSPLEALGDGYFIQCDNILVEFCVPPSASPTTFWNSIKDTLDYINLNLPSHLELLIKASTIMDADQLEDPRALEFGCDADYNAWNGMVNPKPCATEGRLRSAGGHIHIGYENPDIDVSMELIKAMDVYLGLASVLLDEDDRRKELYGKAGAFRFKPYGVEYRSLSNFWIKERELVKFVFDGVKQAVEFVNSDKQFDDEDSAMVQLAINTNDKKLALELLMKYKVSTDKAILAID